MRSARRCWNFFINLFDMCWMFGVIVGRMMWIELVLIFDILFVVLGSCVKILFKDWIESFDGLVASSTSVRNSVKFFLSLNVSVMVFLFWDVRMDRKIDVFNLGIKVKGVIVVSVVNGDAFLSNCYVCAASFLLRLFAARIVFFMMRFCK